MSGSSALVVGAGLAALACATTLHRAGVAVQVIEADDGPGGRVRTDLVDGYRLDRGFQVMLTAYPEAHRQLDLDALDFHAFDPGAMVQLGGESSIIADPFRAPQRLIASALSPALSLTDKLRLAKFRRSLRSVHPATLLRGDDVSTRDALLELGFSQRSIDRFFGPLVGGIQLDPDLVTSRRMFDIIFRMLADGDSAVPALGMQAIPDQLAAQLPDGSIRYNTRVTRVTPGQVETSDEQLTADAIIVAAEGPSAVALLGLPEVASNPASAVYFAADDAPTDEPLVILNGRGGPVLNAAVMTNVNPGYAPPGRHLIVAALPGVVDGQLETAARDTFRSWWGPVVDRWDVVSQYRIAHGQPRQLPPFSPKQAVRTADGTYVCGDHRDTASSQGALYSGRRCAEAVLERMR